MTEDAISQTTNMAKKVIAFPRQSQILASVFSGDQSIAALITKMRADYRCRLAEGEQPQDCVLWLAGAAWIKNESTLKIDHDYFLESDDIGIVRYRPINDPNASYIFVKTQLSMKPEKKECDPSCPVQLSFQRETEKWNL